MKPSVLALVFMTAMATVAVTPALLAQDGEIKVTSVMHPDKSRTDTQTNLSAGTSEEKTYNAAGKLVRRVLYTLDDRGQPTGGTVFSPKGPALYKFTYTRDTRDRISEESDTTVDGKPLRRFVYRFGSSGQVIGIDTYDGNGNLIGSSGQKTRKSRRR